jgi:hypothetical protein
VSWIYTTEWIPMAKALVEKAGVMAKGSDPYPPFGLNLELGDEAREFGARNGCINRLTKIADVDAG